MKKLKLFALCFVAVSLMFTGCSDDDNNGGNGGGGGTNDSYIQGTLSNWATHGVDSVEFSMYYSSGTVYVISTSAVKNGAFKLALPSTIDDRYLYAPDFDEDITLSDESVLINFPDIFAYKDGEDIGGLIYANSGDEPTNAMVYIYANKAVKIMGTEEWYDEKEVYNLNLAKGWNKVYVKMYMDKDDYYVMEYSNTSVSGLNWYLFDYSDDIDDGGAYNVTPRRIK